MRDALLSIRGRLDRAGMMLSGLCAVHCLLGLVLVTLLGLGGQALLDPAIHRAGLALAIAVGTVTLGYRRAAPRPPAAPLAIGGWPALRADGRRPGRVRAPAASRGAC